MAKTCHKCGRLQSYEQWAHLKEEKNKIHMCPECYRQLINEKYPDLEQFVIDLFNQDLSIDEVDSKIRKKHKGEFTDHNAYVFSKSVKSVIKQKIREISQTKEGRQELSEIGTNYIKRGIILIIIGFVLTAFGIYIALETGFPYIMFFFGAVLYGLYYVIKGVYYKARYRQKQELNSDGDKYNKTS